MPSAFSFGDDGGDTGGGSNFFATADFSKLGGAVSDLFGAAGDLSEASGYKKAEAIEKQNAGLAEVQNRVQMTQLNRQIFQAQGATAAEEGGAGFTAGGSAGDIMRSNASQGALSRQVLGLQGQINQNNFAQQAASFSQMATTAEGAAAAAGGGGILNTVAGLAGLLF